MEPNYSLFFRNGKLVNYGNISQLDRPDLVFVAKASFSFEPDANGRPGGKEFDRIGQLETALINELARHKGVHVGHITKTGVMEVVFRFPQETPKSVSLKTGFFKSQNFSLESLNDPEWSWHKKEMLPTVEEQTDISYRMLYAKLAEAGDDNSKPRNVEFAATFFSAEDRGLFLKDVEV
ncbi:MAG TPA: DUF695 domain-containing protein [Fimbriimonadaceae bacterium]